MVANPASLKHLNCPVDNFVMCLHVKNLWLVFVKSVFSSLSCTGSRSFHLTLCSDAMVIFQSGHS